MTANKRRKRRVRARAARTGESYTTALHRLRKSKEKTMANTGDTTQCWFCLEPAHEHKDRRFFVGPGTTICSDCVTRLHELSTQAVPADVRKSRDAALAQRTTESLVEGLRNYAATARSAEASLAKAVDSVRARGVSWADIAAVLDMDPDTAAQRFGQ